MVPTSAGDHAREGKPLPISYIAYPWLTIHISEKIYTRVRTQSTISVITWILVMVPDSFTSLIKTPNLHNTRDSLRNMVKSTMRRSHRRQLRRRRRRTNGRNHGLRNGQVQFRWRRRRHRRPRRRPKHQRRQPQDYSYHTNKDPHPQYRCRRTGPELPLAPSLTAPSSHNIGR
jgi:hypothetical protein